MAHPADLELELVHLGEPAPEVSQHVAGCERCQRFVQSLEAAKAATWRRHPPEEYAHWLRERRGKLGTERRGKLGTGRPALSRWLMRASGGLAVAAGVTLLVTTVLRSDETAWGDPPARAPTAASPEPPGLQRTGQALVPRGSAGLSVIRVRGGEAKIFRDVVPVAPADTIGLQFSIERPARLSAGILTDGGEWAPFFSDQEFPAGLSVPELTLQVNDEPGSGLLLLGPPAQVEAARLGRASSGVQSARIAWSSAP